MTGAQVRRARLALGLSQAALGESTGFSQPYISMIERGQAPVSSLLASFLSARAPEKGKRGGQAAESARLQSPTGQWGQLEPWRPPLGSLLIQTAVRHWQRPSASGDVFAAVPLPRDEGLVVAFDVAGHGREQLPKARYLEGWLRGWRVGFTAVPRLSSITEDLETELHQARLEVAWFVALLSRQRSPHHAIEYQAAARGFPAPLLLVDLPVRTLPSIGERGAVVHHVLQPPWRLVIATDGLIRRLGAGNEAHGKRSLLRWQSGPDRNRDPAAFLQTRAGLSDDELYADLTWEGWDGGARFRILDDQERHRVKRVLREWLSLRLAENRAIRFLAAVGEALSNVMKHAYGGEDGLAVVGWRAEGSRVRVEVEDGGQGSVAEGPGFARMRHDADEVFVSRGAGRGTVVSLTISTGGGS